MINSVSWWRWNIHQTANRSRYVQSNVEQHKAKEIKQSKGGWAQDEESKRADQGLHHLSVPLKEEFCILKQDSDTMFCASLQNFKCLISLIPEIQTCSYSYSFNRLKSWKAQIITLKNTLWGKWWGQPAMCAPVRYSQSTTRFPAKPLFLISSSSLEDAPNNIGMNKRV